jgi:hypothetical protein
MHSVDRTAKLFIESVETALPEARIQNDRYRSDWGYSRYVFVNCGKWWFKIRISDHAVGMRRATSGECDLFLSGGDGPARWAVWLSKTVAMVNASPLLGPRANCG